MPNAILKTLTPIHIGSGRNLTANSEFAYFPSENQLAVIDDKKILSIIGEEQIHHWISVIEKREDILDLVNSRSSDIISPNDIAARIIDYQGDIIKREMREQMHTGMNQPLIPGSSIKGAIRTAVFATKVFNYSNTAIGKIRDFNRRHPKDKRPADSKIIEKVFGSNANDNLFRFIQIGDAIFKDIQTTAVTGKILNLARDWNYKRGQEQLIECIPQGVTTNLKFKINKDLLAKNHRIPNVGVLSDDGRLFKIVNKHTEKQLINELEFWEDEIDNFNTPEIIDIYMDRLRELIQLTQNANSEKEAIFRMGFGSGWNFITGAWAKDKNMTPTDRDFDQLLKKLRRKRYNDDVPFPKTRKLISTHDGLLGFVKLTIQE